MNREVKAERLTKMASWLSSLFGLFVFLVCLSCFFSLFSCPSFLPDICRVYFHSMSVVYTCRPRLCTVSVIPAACLRCLSSLPVCRVCLSLLTTFLFPLFTSLCACVCLQELAICGWTNMAAVGGICEAIYVKYCSYSWVVMVHYFPWAAALQINDLLIDIWTILGPFIQKYIINVGSARFRGGKRRGVCNHAAAFV